MNPGPVLPLPDDLTRFFWTAAKEERLEILRCNACGHFRHWPRAMCNACQSFDLSPAPVSGRGVVVSQTTIIQAFHPSFADRIPYVLAVVELEEEPGLRLVTALVDVDSDEVHIGRAVEVVFERLTEDITLPCFRPSGAEVA